MVSIIIPVYNVAEFVEQCLVSVISQTYSDLEVLIVDDCGTDNSMQIVERVVAEYHGPIMFKILHHDCNRGLSAARNTGIIESDGEYVFFLDSDDTITSNCIQELYSNMILEPDIEMSMGGIMQIGGKLDWGEFATGIHTTNILEMACRYEIYTMAWNKLLKKDFIISNRLFFKEGVCHEDVLWNIQVACYLRKFIATRKKTYNYLIRKGSIQNNVSQEFHHLHMSKVWLSLIEFVFVNGFQDRKVLFDYIQADIYKYICCRKTWAIQFYKQFRCLEYWGIVDHLKFGTGKKVLLLSFHKYLPTYLGLYYYRFIYRMFFM